MPIERTTTLYRKVLDEFVPVSEYSEEFSHSFKEGCHLVVIRPGSHSRKYNVDPEFAPLIAAGRFCEDEIAMSIVKASEARPTRSPVTQEQADAWRAFQAAMGGHYMIEYASARECAEVGLQALIEEADKLMKHEAVRKAYEQFMLVCQLVKEKA